METTDMDQRLASILALYDETAPLNEARTIPAPWYFDPAIAKLEEQHVFGGSWQVVGRCQSPDSTPKHREGETDQSFNSKIL